MLAKLRYLFLLLVPLVSKGQTIKDTLISIPMIAAQGAFQFPGGDMAKRFGPDGTIGASFYYKTASNWLLGGEFNFIFGGTVKEDPLRPLETRDSFMIALGGTPQVINYYERGYTTFAKLGKIFPKFGPNMNSGIFLKGGVGFIQHKIKYYWTGDGPPQLHGDYVKGYDRLTNGLAITESAGYMHLSNKNFLNFSAELELIQGFTQNRRSWDFDLMAQDTRQRLDLFYGIKLIWYVPLYGKNSGEISY
jgi:hypothetical protein